MKVCILTTSFPAYKGHYQGSFIYELAKSLSKSIDVSVVCPYYNVSKKKYETWGKVKIHRFQYFYPKRLQKLTSVGGIPTNIKSILGKIQLPFFILSMLRAGRDAKDCDIIHAQWTLSALVGIYLKHRYKKTLILTTRGDAANSFLKSSPFKKRILRYILGQCDYITPNNYNHKKIFTKLGFKDVMTVPNGIDFKMFKPRNKEEARNRLGLPIDKTIILSVGWLIPRKGYIYLINAASKLKDLLFIIVGNGIQKEKFTKMIHDQGIENVMLKEAQDHFKIPWWMNAADLFILPSLSEGRPNVIPEALASGVPVIATKVSGTPEFIKDNGILIKPKSTIAIVKAIQTLLTNKEMKSRYESNARESVKELSWKRCSKKYIEVYKSI